MSHDILSLIVFSEEKSPRIFLQHRIKTVNRVGLY